MGGSGEHNLTPATVTGSSGLAPREGILEKSVGSWLAETFMTSDSTPSLPDDGSACGDSEIATSIFCQDAVV